jgi:hypothetical protein
VLEATSKGTSTEPRVNRFFVKDKSKARLEAFSMPKKFRPNVSEMHARLASNTNTQAPKALKT